MTTNVVGIKRGFRKAGKTGFLVFLLTVTLTALVPGPIWGGAGGQPFGTIEKEPQVLNAGAGKEYGYRCENDSIEVMFIYGSRVRLRKGRLVDEGLDALRGLEQVMKDLPGAAWRRLCDVPEEFLDQLQANGEARTGKPVYNLNNIYRLRIPPAHDVWEVCRRLETLKGVHLARPVPLPVPPPLPPNYQNDQGYLDPASSTPTGIDAEYAWTKPGGDGTGITVCDVEGEWQYDHNDLTKLIGSQLNSACASYYGTDHGTAVAGELIANNNGWGVTGICYGATIKTSCDYYGNPFPDWNPAGAIALAVAHLTAGDVILLEEQWDYNKPGPRYNYLPIEWWEVYFPTTTQSYNAVYAAIVNAVSNGIHVVEAAGNGYFDLDTLVWQGDSGAIIVGAGGAYPGGDWPEGDLEKLSFSDYGSRVNLQGWGEDVYTTGYGDLYSSEGETYYYTDTFAGTSSASPIVAGAAACCLGYWTNGLHQPKNALTPSQLRTILIDTGTPQVNPSTGHIGPRPDLLQAFQYLESIVSPTRPPWIHDYNGDGTSDIAVFRGSTGMWSVRNLTRAYFGSADDDLVPGDYNGDQTTDIAIFRQSTGMWSVRSLSRFYLGVAGDAPVPGDYVGNGTAEAGLFRASAGLWAIRNLTRAYFGSTGDSVVPGYYNSDDAKDIAIFRGSTGMWSIRGVTRFYFGSASDDLVPGDYNGAGKWEGGIFRPSSGMWSIRNFTRIYLGSTYDQAVPADYNGNGADGAGIFRDSSGLWSVRNLTRVYFGSTNDIPVTR